MLKKEEGGRHTPFFTGYRPQFYFRTTDVTGVAKLPEGVEMVMPGDNVQMEIELIQPIAMDQGLRFAIREGGRTVGSGVVTNISSSTRAPAAHRGPRRPSIRSPIRLEALAAAPACGALSAGEGGFRLRSALVAVPAHSEQPMASTSKTQNTNEDRPWRQPSRTRSASA